MTSNLSVIVLAAGRSRRMGRTKPLLPLGDKTVLQQVLTALCEVNPARILVVLGSEGGPIADGLGDYAVSILWNPARDSEMADSLRCALPALPPEDHGVMICLGDQPLIAPATYRTLSEQYLSRPGAIVQPQNGGRKGHPVLLPRALLEEIRTRATLRDLLAAHAARVQLVEVADPGILQDIDTPQDYQRALHLWARAHGRV